MILNSGQRCCEVLIDSASIVHKGEVLRFLTLTSADGMKRSLSNSWYLLKTEIRRLSIERLLKDGYLNNGQIEYFYGDKDIKEFLDFEFIAIYTSEGVCGVIHILYYGDYIPQKWLSDKWLYITGSARIVDIKKVGGKFKDNNSLNKYVVRQYVSGQSKFLRYSSSRNFVFENVLSFWKVHERCYRELIWKYNRWCRGMFVVGGRERCWNDWCRKLKRYRRIGIDAMYKPAKIDGKMVDENTFI